MEGRGLIVVDISYRRRQCVDSEYERQGRDQIIRVSQRNVESLAFKIADPGLKILPQTFESRVGDGLLKGGGVKAGRDGVGVLRDVMVHSCFAV